MEPEAVVQDLLAHHGVRGMKWGVRRSRGATEVAVTQKGKKLKASGGSGHTPHPDAVKAKSISQQLKKSGAHSLSNEQLQTLTNRLNLEQSAKRLHSQSSSANRLQRGNAFAGEVLKSAGHLAAGKKLATKQA
jgi:hypothetical protein